MISCFFALKYFKTNDQRIYLATYLSDLSKSGEISDSTAKEISLKIINDKIDWIVEMNFRD